MMFFRISNWGGDEMFFQGFVLGKTAGKKTKI
jgi:hypothetical protein